MQHAIKLFYYAKKTDEIDDFICMIDDNNKDLYNELINIAICAIDTTLTPFYHKYYLSENILNSEVYLFSNIDKYFIVFLEIE